MDKRCGDNAAGMGEHQYRAQQRTAIVQRELRVATARGGKAPEGMEQDCAEVARRQVYVQGDTSREMDVLSHADRIKELKESKIRIL